MMKIRTRAISLMILLTLTLQVFSILPQKFNAESSGKFEYTVEIDDSATITEYKGSEKSVTIPDVLDGHKVKMLDGGAFSDNTKLEELTIEGNIDTICTGAVYGCTKLQKVTLGSSLRLVQTLAIDACNKLTTVKVKNGVKVFEGNAINSKSLKSISLPNSVSRVGAMFTGYYYDEDEDKTSKISGFKISGYSGSAVETYATENSFTFNSSGKFKAGTASGDYMYDISENGVYLYKYLGVGGNVKIPEKIDNLPVSEIDPETFSEYSYADVNGNYLKKFKYITALTFPSGCIALNDDQVIGCQKLKSATFSKTIEDIEPKSIGYFYDLDNDKYKKLSDFKIIGYSGTIAEYYAKENGFTFDSLGVYTEDEETSVQTQSDTQTITEASVPQNSTTEDTSSVVPYSAYISYPLEDETQMPKPTYTVPTVSVPKVSVTSVENIKLNKKSAVICTSQKLILTASVTPEKADNKQIRWTSSDTKTAKVNSNGVVTGIKNGNVKITASAVDGSGIKAVCKVKVVQGIKKISLDKTLVNVNNAGTKTFTLVPTITPDNAENNSVQWKSSDEKVATVNKKGKVKVISAGSSVITCKALDGSEKYAECVVINGALSSSVAISEKSITVKAGTSHKLSANAMGGVCKIVKWSSGNKNVATVNQGGKVTGIKPGTAVITAKAVDGSKKTAKCTVAVKCHNYGKWKTVVKPDCMHEGLKTKVCKACGNTVSKTLPKGDHSWENKYTVDAEPLCTEDGTASIHCKICNAVKDKKLIPAVGHYYSIITVTDEPTCTEEGEATKKCYTCGMQIVTVLPAKGHRWADEKTVDKEPTCVTEGIRSTHCLDCDEVKDTEKISKTDHHITKYITTKPATMSSDGTKVGVCYNCDVLTDYKIDKISTVKLKTKSFEYDGKVKKPEVVVRDSKGKKLVLKTDYTVSYQKGRTNVNEYTVTVDFINDYQGTNTQVFKIIPKSTKIKSLKSNKGKVTVKWQEQSEKTDGYQVQYGLKSDLSDKKNLSVSGSKNTSAVIEKLTTGKIYYVAVRTFKIIKVDGKEKRIYSKRSQIKSITVK